jgi:large subunit ribosomal protein L7/L12
MADEEKKEVVAESAETAAEDVVVEMTPEQKKIVDHVEKMTVLELHELVKVLEKKFGVSAQAAAAPAPSGGADGGAEEKSTFTVELTESGAQKIAVIKVVKEVLGLGLKEAKDMVDGAPGVLKDGVAKEEAEEIKKKIEGAGGKVTLK